MQPPTRRTEPVDVRGLGARHWSLLMLLAAHGPLDTSQVTTLMFGSRPAAVRHLTALVRAELVWRFVYDDDSSHLAYYEPSTDGLALLEQRLHTAGRAAPPGLGRAASGQSTAAAFLVALTEATRRGLGHLYRWRRAADTAVWLRQHGVPPVAAAGHGLWIEDGVTVSFLLHVDWETWYSDTGRVTVPASLTVDGYRHATGIPAGVVLVLCASAEREQQLHAELAALPVPVRVAATTLARLHELGPVAAVWTVAGAAEPVRLIDLARP